MKRNRFKMLWGLMLSIVLLASAAVPFVALAQSVAKPADKPETKAAQSEAGTIRLSGVIDGRGFFVFHGNTVEYRHEAYEQPTGISINGKSWDDLKKPFELGFVPDFGKAVIVEKQGRNRVELTPGKESFSLLIDDTDSSIGVYYVTIDTTGTAPRSATPEGSPRRTPGTALEREQETRAELESLIRSLEGTPGVSEAQLEMLRKRMERADREIENMQRQAQPRNNTARNGVSVAADVSVTTEPDQNGEISITIDGNIRENGHFTFLGNTISYEPREDYLKKTTMTITVNGKPWSITNSKCTLDITPDFEKAAIVEMQGQKSVMLIPGKDRIELYVGGFDSMDQKCHVKIALKNQIPRGNTRSVWIATSSPEPSEKPDEPQELRLMLSGSFFNRDAFTFEGNTVRYRNEDGEEARDVRINYLPWRDLSRPFELDFTPDFDKASILPVQELQERTTITLEAEPDKFELVLDHAVKDKSYYKFVRLAVKDQVDRRLVRSVRGSAPVRMPSVNGGFGPQPMPDFGFPNISLDMNGMPKSGRPAFEESNNNRTMFPGAAPSRSGVSDPAENKEVTLTLEGNFSGYDSFYFKEQSISYQQRKLAYQREPRPLPTDVKINGVPWDDLSKPFELGYTPDFPRAVVLEEVAPYAAGLSRSTTQLQLHFNHPGPPSGYYRFKIAMKDQLRREPEGGFSPFGIMFRAATVDGPTDGMLHPATAVTRPIYPRDTHDSARVEVRGTVDRKAGFRMENGNTIVYQNYETDPERTAPEDPVVLFDGKFASEVTLSDTRDQKAWTNLSIPKGNPGSTAGPGGGSAMFSTSKTTHFIFRGEDCDYVYFEHDGVMEIIITNKTDQPAKFQFIMWNGGDKVFEDNDMQYAPVFGPQTKTATEKGGTPAGGASLAPPPPLLSPAPKQGDVSYQNPVPGYGELPGTITIEGDFQGRGLFLFNVGEEQVAYRHEERKPPLNVTVNGKPWENLDKPFKFGFAIPGEPVMLETEAEDLTRHLPVYMITGDQKKFEMLIHENAGPRHYRIVIGTSEHVKQRQELIREINAKIRDISISVEGKLDAKDAFVFEGNTVRFRPSGDRYPDSLSVNAQPWPVTDKPFELSFAPDFSKAVTVQSSGENNTKQPTDKDKFEITFGEIVSSDEIPKTMWFNLKVAILRDKIPRSPNAVNPPAPGVPTNHKTAAEAQVEIEAAASAAAGLPAGKFPTIMNGPMMITSIREPTDGIDHPDYTVTSPVRAPRFRPEEKIVVKGTVAMEAGFRIQGDRLHYLNFYAIGGAVSGSNLRIYDGRFASGVTVNGKPWTNLTRPFDLDVSLTPTTGKYIGFKAEHCEYDYQFHHDFIEIRITNKKREPAPFELTLWLFDNPVAQKGKEQHANAAQTQFGAENAADDTDEDDVNDGRMTTRGDFHYNGLSDVIYVRKEANGIRLEYGLNGMNDLQEQKVGDRQLPDPSFRFLGGYDMDKDHRVDIVAWRAIENDSGKHIEVGYGKSGELDDWHVIGMLGIPDGVDWALYCGNLSGHWDRNSILWHSPSLGTMGYWPDGKGVESWITIPGEYKGPEWKILGLGDFTGAKKPRDSVLLRFGPNTIATVSANGKYTNLGWLGEDWKVVAIDDFSNDGCDDLILFNETLRQVGKWDDGKISKWSSIGFVEDGTAIEGAGDYDGDGWTDLLVRQPDGAMGYFPKADLNKFVPFGYKKDPSWIVIP